ncbi:MAG: ferrous iron transport protein B [Bacteroidetes bacterium GWA2_32_17]|nr:MAG: ferrous iron transport protein B [Bacteroidetes bacterium GWA2_32_17]
MNLSDLKTGETGIITKVVGHGAFRKRITEMGFVKGKKVKVIKNAPLQDPVEYEIMDYKVSLRRTEAQLVEVIAADKTNFIEDVKFEGTIDEETLKLTAGEKSRTINVALVGNPNSGKTTLYNFASGSHERVGNYGGVTVDAREATFKQSSYTFKIVDLPGTYSITEYTPEELFVRTHITEKNPDIIVNVIDASNLERNLYLTTQLIDMNIKVVIALNMYDELEKKNAKLDYKALGKMIGIPIIPTVASKGKGISELFDKLIEVYEDKDTIVRHIHINYGNNIETAIAHIQILIKENKEITDKFSSRYLAIKLLETDSATLNQLSQCSNIEKIKKQIETEIKILEKEYKEKSGTIITDAKYGFIAGALNETFKPCIEGKRKKITQIDDFLTHRFFGFPIFIFFMWLMFQVTFTVGSYPMDLIDSGVGWLGELIENSMAEGPLRDLLVDGIIGGVGGVIIFLPNILILFFFISFMEDTGYMARASFIMDKLMHKIGLHGKSFIPMLMGFGCNVPAIMATRTLENKKDRLLTMMIIPLMSCSARLPVYVLLISTFFPENQGLVLISIYIIGVIVAVLVALAMKKILFAKQDVPFVMELPPYRIPTLKNTSIHMWHKGAQYIKKMGSVILLASIIIWALGYFPRNVKYSANYDEQIAVIKSDNNLTDSLKKEQSNKIELIKQSEKQEKSYIGQMGHFIEPVIRPLGFDWKIGVSIITGLAAKEIVVSTMGVLYQADFSNNESSANMQNRLKEQTFSQGELKGQKVFTPLTAYAMMLFVLIYFPCIAVIAAIKKESDIKWAVFTMIYTTGLAWLIAFLTYQIGSLFI